MSMYKSITALLINHVGIKKIRSTYSYFKLGHKLSCLFDFMYISVHKTLGVEEVCRSRQSNLFHNNVTSTENGRGGPVCPKSIPVYFFFT